MTSASIASASTPCAVRRSLPAEPQTSTQRREHRRGLHASELLVAPSNRVPDMYAQSDMHVSRNISLGDLSPVSDVMQ